MSIYSINTNNSPISGGPQLPKFVVDNDTALVALVFTVAGMSTVDKHGAMGDSSAVMPTTGVIGTDNEVVLGDIKTSVLE